MKKAAKLPKPAVAVTYYKWVNDIKTEGAFGDKLDKVNHILKTAGLPKETLRTA